MAATPPFMPKVPKMIAPLVGTEDRFAVPAEQRCAKAYEDPYGEPPYASALALAIQEQQEKLNLWLQIQAWRELDAFLSDTPFIPEPLPAVK